MKFIYSKAFKIIVAFIIFFLTSNLLDFILTDSVNYRSNLLGSITFIIILHIFDIRDKKKASKQSK